MNVLVDTSVWVGHFKQRNAHLAGLLEAGEADPEAPPATASASATSLVSGVVTDASGPLSLLDAQALLGLRSALPSAR